KDIKDLLFNKIKDIMISKDPEYGNYIYKIMKTPAVQKDVPYKRKIKKYFDKYGIADDEEEIINKIKQELK
ncbi:hypothetical protein KAU15_05785, partial [candidate division WOR-3 bacterium]|nr:hypothetical protein [candidate division WOR-3 bacterium]